MIWGCFLTVVAVATVAAIVMLSSVASVMIIDWIKKKWEGRK